VRKSAAHPAERHDVTRSLDEGRKIFATMMMTNDGGFPFQAASLETEETYTTKLSLAFIIYSLKMNCNTERRKILEAKEVLLKNRGTLLADADFAARASVHALAACHKPHLRGSFAP
jgi:hypothetical protein